MPTDEEAITYTDALMRLNDLCGSLVTARVSDEEGAILSVRGILTHVENGLWANYTLGEAELDLGTYQQWDRHWASGSGSAVAFYMPTGTTTDVFKSRPE